MKAKPTAKEDYDEDFQLLIGYLGAIIGDHNPMSDDRTLAIVTAAYAEKYLGVLIQKRLPGLNSELRTKMFDPTGAIGTLAVRIDLARALNAIDADMRHDLLLMASIRNRFAHNLQIQSFDHPKIAEKTAKIRWRAKMVPGEEGAEEFDRKWAEKFQQWPSGVRFRNMALWLLTAIGNATLPR